MKVKIKKKNNMILLRINNNNKLNILLNYSLRHKYKNKKKK